MEIKLQELYDLYALVEAVNDSTYESRSIIVKDSELNNVVLRISKKMEVEVGKIYHFHGKGEVFKEKNYIGVLSLVSLDDDKDMSDDDKRALKDKFFGGIVIDTDAYIKDIEDSIKVAVENGELQCIVSVKKYTDKRFEDFFDEDIKYIIDILEGMEYKVIAQWSLTSIDTMKILIDWRGELN